MHTHMYTPVEVCRQPWAPGAYEIHFSTTETLHFLTSSPCVHLTLGRLLRLWHWKCFLQCRSRRDLASSPLSPSPNGGQGLLRELTLAVTRPSLLPSSHYKEAGCTAATGVGLTGLRCVFRPSGPQLLIASIASEAAFMSRSW